MNKKAQEEIVGFVLIILLVVIVMVIFLGISLRTGDKEVRSESEMLGSFRASVLRYTTNCTVNNNKQTVRELIDRCIRGGRCENGENICDFLENELKSIMENSLYIVSEDSPTKGYGIEIGNEDNMIINISNKAYDNYCPGIISYYERPVEEDYFFKISVCRVR